jgi:hypothetical protein
MELRLVDGKVIALRAIVASGFIGAFLFALVLSAAPQLHERIHQPIGAAHECAVTLIASGKYQQSDAPVLVSVPQPAVQWEKIPSVHPVWVAAPFLGACIFEHAPPALS